MLTYADARRQVLDVLRITSPEVPAFETGVRDAAQEALNKFQLTLVQGTIPVEWRTRLYAERTTENTGAYVVAVSDNRVLKFTDSTGLLAPEDWVPQTNGTWDHLYEIEITDENGRLHRFTCWEFWAEETNDTATYYVSLNKPSTLTVGNVVYKFKLRQPYLILPAWTTGFYSYRPGGSEDGSYVITMESGRNITRAQQRLGAYQYSGYLHVARAHQPAIPQLRTAPTVSATHNGGWEGPEQEGTFMFYATVVAGRADSRHGIGNTDIVDPIIESAPTPVSVQISHNTYSGRSIVIRANNPDAMLAFDTPSLREGRTGLRVRFYVKRLSLLVMGAGSRNEVDVDEIPYLLTEVDPVPGDMTVSYTWSGESIDRTRRLPGSHAPFAYQVLPLMSADTDFTFNLTAPSINMWTDEDGLPIHELATSAFITTWARFLAPKLGATLTEVAELDRIATLARQEVTLLLHDKGVTRLDGSRLTPRPAPGLPRWYR